jgi:hypothetical protein
MGESPGYDRQVAFMSLGFEELGLASDDIQLVIPCCPYSYVRVLDALDGTWNFSASLDVDDEDPAFARNGRLTLGIGGIALTS